VEIVAVGAEQRAELLITPFVSSWAHLARPGDRGAADPKAATAAWSAWLLSALVQVSTSRRSYTAVGLDGRVYASGRLGLQAHLEIPHAVWQRPDPLFPARLAAAGAALRFPSLLFDEVVAIRRTVLATPTSPELLDGLAGGRERLREGVAQLTGQLVPVLDRLDLVGDPQTVTAAISSPADGEELAAILPEAAGWRLSIDPQLVERSGPLLARRLLVWTVSDATGSLPALTPRLTRSSTVLDPLFAPERETPAACLARLVLLSRVARLLGLDPSGVVPPPPQVPGFLRAVPAKAGQETPSASLSAAAAFVTQHPDAADAFARLGALAEGRYVLLVGAERYALAHRRLAAALARAEDPERVDVDVVLPLLASSSGALARATFARRPTS
jgi:hypothetical protein